MSHTTTNVGGSKTGWATLKLTNSVERREAQKFNIQKSEAQKATQLHEQESIKKVGALECTTTPVLKGRMWASVGEDGAGKVSSILSHNEPKSDNVRLPLPLLLS